MLEVFVGLVGVRWLRTGPVLAFGTMRYEEGGLSRMLVRAFHNKQKEGAHGKGDKAVGAGAATSMVIKLGGVSGKPRMVWAYG